ncbi:DUF6794 domain-containing protein [Caballeronia mineralivorans]|jgi:hypothetical protein|uniref:DUF6794 domain-containing protein n=1 Tax=Caballeronia mineralivorans TaxID=2010198 RepID=UPI0023F314DF|nr:DUF6794 domain-containing protein [Caballeronia mineralivorans]
MSSPKIIATILCFLLIIAPAAAVEADVLGADKWPETVEATVRMIISSLPDKDRLNVKNTKKEDLIRFHHGWGTGIRNYYGLWRGNKKLILSACGKPCHPDDASMVIIEAVWEELQNEVLRPG